MQHTSGPAIPLSGPSAYSRPGFRCLDRTGGAPHYRPDKEKRGFREKRVLENVKNSTSEINEAILPKCKKTMDDGLTQALQTLNEANHTIGRLQQRQQQVLMNEALKAAGENNRAERSEILKEQEFARAAVDEEHEKAMQRLREQYAAMEKELAKSASF